MNREIRLEKIINESYKNIAGIVVQKNGKQVYEKYYNGCTATDPIHIASATKSIVSALFGIAIGRGEIKGVDQKILEFFPEYQVLRGEKTIQNITIENMLTMTTPYKYKNEPFAKVMTGDHWIKDALDLVGGKGKVGDFLYSALVGVQILSGILKKATGKSMLDYATEHLFGPLGIQIAGNLVLPSEEESLAFLKGKGISGWATDPEGFNTAGWGLTLTPLDMAKIGQMYLQHGVWEGKQIVPEDWIEESTKEHSRWDKLSYGYLWWCLDKDEQSYAALGQYGNVIYVNPKKDMVISIASLYTEREKDCLVLIKNYLEPLFEGK